MSKRDIARQLLEVNHLPTDYEVLVYNSNSPYEDTIRKLLRGIPLQKALGIVEVPDSVTQCRCGSYKVLERSMQTRSADEGTTSFYFCTACQRHWKV
jgi:DNA-directed RNA polymerase subunit M/transcription elongation factor TFIIS